MTARDGAAVAARKLRKRLLTGPALAGATRVIAVDGRSGAGKTSLAAALREQLDDAPVVTLEDLYDGWDGLARGIALLVTRVLEPLAAGQAVQVPRYDWVAGTWGVPWRLEPPPVLIVEGVGAGARRAAAYASVLIWVEASAAARKQRALDRDGDTFAPHWDAWAAQEDALLARERTPDRADLVIDGLTGTLARPWGPPVPVPVPAPGRGSGPPAPPSM